MINGVERNVPDFLIVGAAKCGTTSLHAYLSKHSKVVMPRSKETLFFHAATNRNQSQFKFLKRPIVTFEDYLREFDEAAATDICGESCPSYLYYYQHAIANIQQYHPRWKELKIVIIVREPVDKTISHYFFVKNTLGKREPALKRETLETSLQLEEERRSRDDVLPDLLYVDTASYSKQIRAYMDVFPKVKVFLFDDLRDDPQQVYEQLCEYLGISPELLGTDFDIRNQGVREAIPNGSLGRTIARASKWRPLAVARYLLPLLLRERIWSAITSQEDVSEETRQALRCTFAGEVARLEALLDVDLDRWGYR